MLTTINTIPTRPPPVFCNFWWGPRETLKSFIIDGQTFPYQHQEQFNGKKEVVETPKASDSRYESWSTFIRASITFDAIDSKKEGHPKIKLPAGIFVVEYLWDFGDGYTGNGPTVNHEFIAADPFTAVELRILDSRGLTFTCKQNINLLFATAGGPSFEGMIGGPKVIS